MKTNGFSHIRRWLLLYVVVALLATLSTYLFVYNELAGMLTESVRTSSDPLVGQSAQPSEVSTLSGIKLNLLLVLSTSFMVIFFLSVLWYRIAVHQLNRPIHAIRRAVTRLAQGKLNETVTLESADELGQIGSGINELAANLQELLLHIWKQTGRCMAILDHIQNSEKLPDGEAATHLSELTAAIENLRDMAKAYVFYDVRLEGDQALAINHPGRKEQSAGPPQPRSLSE